MKKLMESRGFTNRIDHRSLKQTEIPFRLVGCFGLNGLFLDSFQSISGRLPERGRKEREMID